MQYKDEILVAIPTLLSRHQILYFIDLIVIAIVVSCKWIRIKSKDGFKGIPVLITLICIVFFCTSYHFIPESLELVTGFIYSKYKSVRYGTIYGYHFVDIKNAVTNNKCAIYSTYDEMIKAYLDLKKYQKQSPENEEFKGIAEGKNVLWLIGKSMEKKLHRT